MAFPRIPTLGVFGAAVLLSLAAAAQAQTSTAAPVAGGVRLGVTVTEMNVVANGWSVKKSLLDHKVVNEEGKTLGKVEDLIVAPDKALSFAILEVGGFLGIGEHRIAIPIDQFKWGADGKVMLPGATKDSLKDLPKFVYAKKH